MYVYIIRMFIITNSLQRDRDRDRNTKRKRKNGNNRRLKMDIKSYRIIIVYRIYLDLIKLLTLLWLVQLYII